MFRNAVRTNIMFGCLVSLSLFHLLWSAKAAEQANIDPKVLDNYVARPVGPVNMSGRVTSIAGLYKDTKTLYVGAASGGVWKTQDGGASWKCVFENEGSSSIGDVAVSQSNPNIVWVGTGEAHPRNSVGWGVGVYKSTDGGATWKHMGLRDSHSIGRVVIHPTNPDIVYVAVLGHIWGPNKERGIFKTIDGGKTWEHNKYWDDNTGAIELKMHPTDPDTLLCAAWEVRRDAFSGGEPVKVHGPHAGIYKTTNGGKTWDKMTEGLPTGMIGRVGMDYYRKDPNVVYAIVNAKGKGGKGLDDPDDPNGGGGDELISFQAGKDQKKDDQKKDDPKKGDPQKGGKGGKGGGGGPGGPDSGGTYRSEDGGKTWKNLNTTNPRPMYFSQIRVDPNDDKRIYLAGVNYYVSDDGGKTYETRGSSNIGSDTVVHADHHALWINPDNSKEVFLGNDGGIYISRDGAKTAMAVRAMNIGQAYGISADMSKPYYVYAGYQDNGAWGGPSANYYDGGLRRQEFFFLTGGDGFHTRNDPTDPTIVYSESQNGGLQRVNVAAKKKDTSGFMPGGMGGGGGKKGGGDPAKKDDPTKKDDKKKDDVKKDDKKNPTPFDDEQKKDDQKKDDPKKDEPQKGKGGFDPKQFGKGGGMGGGSTRPPGANRWNWSTPMHVSAHDPWTFYYGSQYLWVSHDRASTWKQLSPDLTYGPDMSGKGGKKDEPKKDDPKKDDPKKDDPGQKKDDPFKGGKGGKGGGGGGGTGAHSLFTIGESPRKRTILWTGSDDGRIHVTKDGGAKWTDVSKIPSMPKDSCISRVTPSYFDDGACYVSITRYRNDDRKPYIFKTTDYGETWKSLSSNLPEDGSVHVVIQSSRNKDLLFCGTEFGLFVSFNDGAAWHQLKGGLPTVAVHDLVIHPRERDLLVGTHGRAIWIYDNIAALEELTSQVAAKPAHLFDVRPATAFTVKPHKFKLQTPGEFEGKNPTYGASIDYLVKSPAAVSINILEAGTGKQVATLKGASKAGLNRAVWNLRPTGQDALVAPGEYVVVMDLGDHKQYKILRVEPE